MKISREPIDLIVFIESMFWWYLSEISRVNISDLMKKCLSVQSHSVIPLKPCKYSKVISKKDWIQFFLMVHHNYNTYNRLLLENIWFIHSSQVNSLAGIILIIFYLRTIEKRYPVKFSNDQRSLPTMNISARKILPEYLTEMQSWYILFY